MAAQNMDKVSNQPLINLKTKEFKAFLSMNYLTFAGAILLINDNGIFHTIHGDIFKSDI